MRKLLLLLVLVLAASTLLLSSCDEQKEQPPQTKPETPVAEKPATPVPSTPEQAAPAAPAQPAPTTSTEPKMGGTLIFGRGGDSVGLDPAYETDGNSFMICDNVLEALVAYKDESTELEPGLAESWDISEDGKTYTFHLRQGVKFHDGTDMDANAVVFSIARMMKEPKVVWVGEGYKIPAQERSPEYWASMEMDKVMNSIEAKDPLTVVFKLNEVSAPFLANMGMDFADVISPKAFLADPKEFGRHPVGTGPFKFVEWVKDDKIVLEKNKEYWGAGKGGGPYLDQVIFRAIPENSVRFLELKSGGIQICQYPSAADIPMAEKDPNLKLVKQPGMNIGYLSFNHTKKLWQNVHLRRAIAYGIDRKAIVDNIYQGMGEVAKNPIPPFMPGWNPDVPDIPYDPELAKKELAEAGYPEGKGLPELTLWSMPVPRPYNPEGLKVGIAMIGDLSKIGITARIVSYDWGTYLKRQREQPEDMDMFQLGWTGDNGDADNFLAVLFDGMSDPSVRTQWKDQTYHDLIVKGRTTIDPAKRAEIYKEALKYFRDQIPAIPIAHSTSITPLQKNVMNYKLHPTDSIYLQNVWIE